MMEEAALTSSRMESVAATAPAEKAVPLPLGHGSLREEKMRRGEYRNFTFRLPAHVPEIQLSVAAECGSICLYASNCSERPTPRLCQWTLLVDAEKQKMGSLKVKTSEHHFVTGLYHVGLYCVSDSSFSLGCFTTTPSPSDVLHAAQKRRSQQLAECPRRQGQPPPPLATQARPQAARQWRSLQAHTRHLAQCTMTTCSATGTAPFASGRMGTPRRAGSAWATVPPWYRRAMDCCHPCKRKRSRRPPASCPRPSGWGGYGYRAQGVGGLLSSGHLALVKRWMGGRAALTAQPLLANQTEQTRRSKGYSRAFSSVVLAGACELVAMYALFRSASTV